MRSGYHGSMQRGGTVADLMTRDVITVNPDTALLAAASILARHNLTGLPVVDEAGRVVGILTEYDLITKGSAIHLPTFLKLMREFDVYRRDQTLIREELKGILALTVRDAMNPEPLVLAPETSIAEACRTFGEHHRVNPIPIVDGSRKLVGILSRFDIIRLYAGTNPHPARAKGSPEETDRAVSEFLQGFERNFIAVSRFRARFWLLLSAAFLILGIIITLFFLARVEVNYP